MSAAATGAAASPAAVPSSPAPAAASTAVPSPSASPSKPSTAAGLSSPSKTPSKGGKLGATKTGPITAIAPVEEEKPIVFKGATRAKKVFKLFDHDQDKFLNRQEFETGLRAFINAPELPPLTTEQIDALWLETDCNQDGRVSWAEFNYRFCGGPNPLLSAKNGGKPEKKLSLHLQTPRKKDPAAMLAAGGKPSASSVMQQQLTNLLEATYDGAKPRFPKDKVDLSKSKALNPTGLKKLLSQVLAEEKAEAKAAKRPLESWAAPFATAAIEQKAVDKLFASLDTQKTGKTIDLTQLFEQLKLRPSSKSTHAKSKKKKDVKHTSGPQAYTLTTIKPEHVRDFVSEQILKHMPQNQPPHQHSVKCHPPLKHWGDDERRKKGLNTEGYKTMIFLSERTKVKAVVKLAPPEPAPTAASATAASSSPDHKSPAASARHGLSSATASSAAAAAAAAASSTVEPVNPSDILIFAAYRTEYTAMARFESLWHARITMDAEENVRKVDVAEKKNWVDGELDKCLPEPSVFEDWITYVGFEDEFEEMSIPPIA